MAQPIVTRLIIGQKTITNFSSLLIQQTLFGHHQLSVQIPFDALEGSNLADKEYRTPGYTIASLGVLTGSTQT